MVLGHSVMYDLDKTLVAGIIALLLIGCSGMKKEKDGSHTEPIAISIIPMIAFWSEKDGNPEVYTMRLDGSEFTRLTNNPAEDSYPVFSPDGTKIVFESDRTGNFEIYLMNVDGSDQRQLTETPEDEVSSSWSPDGSKIIFVSFRDGETSEIYVMDADGSNETRLTNNVFDDEAPHFSPDGNYIVTESGKERSKRQVYIMNADGSDHRPLTQMDAYNGYPSWSSDGTKIVFDSSPADQPPGIYSMDADGSNITKLGEGIIGTFANWAPDNSGILFLGSEEGSEKMELYVIKPDGSSWKRITNNDYEEIAPSWNPASFKSTSEKVQKVAFHSDRDGNTEIYSIHADGSNETRLTNDNAYDGFPSWSPDGSQILFQSDRDGDMAIYKMNADGSGVVKISNTKGGNYAKWSRDGSKIAFFADVDGDTEIVVINADGSNPVNLTNNPATDETPSWTSDGSRMTFQTNRGAKEIEGEDRLNYGIYMMASDGSNQTQITGFETNDENPSISPDGKQVVFQSYIDAGLAIVVVDTDGTNKRILTVAEPPCGSPAWSGDGSSIAFDSMRDGNFEIFSMNIDGSEQKQLTFTEGEVENSGACWTHY